MNGGNVHKFYGILKAVKRCYCSPIPAGRSLFCRRAGRGVRAKLGDGVYMFSVTVTLVPLESGDKNTIKLRTEHGYIHFLKVLEGCGEQKFAVWQTSCTGNASAVLLKKFPTASLFPG